MGVDLVLKDGEIVTPNGVFKGGIAVQGGRVTAITSSSSLPPASKVIDCDGLHILPGVIDAHVHFMDPGRPEREDFTTGTTAAAAGGITLVMDMPMTTPAVTDATIFGEETDA
jgi:dihydroorotase